MIQILATILYPLTFAMNLVFEAFHTLTGSAGVAIILLAVIVSLIAQPLRRRAGVHERVISDRIHAVNAEVKALRGKYFGEDRFNEIEKIYRKHGYHPIQNVGLGLSFVVVLPFLLAAIFLFTDNPILQGTPFLFVSDLSEPDAAAWGLNILPMTVFSISSIEARLRFSKDTGRFWQFVALSAVITALIYFAPAALVVYWLFLNVLSLVCYGFSCAFLHQADSEQTDPKGTSTRSGT